MSGKIEVDRDLVIAADSMLSLLRHRGDIRNWGATGFVETYEVDHLIGQLRAAYERPLYDNVPVRDATERDA